MMHACTTVNGDRGAVAERLARQDAEIASLSGEILERYEEATFVYRLSDRIGAVLGESAIARLVVEDVAGVLGAPQGSVWLRMGEGDWKEAAAWPARKEAASDFATPGLRETLLQGRPWMPDGATPGDPALAVGIPDGSGALLGGIVLGARASGRPFRAGDLKLLTAVAALASSFLRNQRLVEKARRSDARQREDEIARQVHRQLLPRDDPRIDGLDVAGGFRAAEIVGGDFYGYITPPDGSLGLAVADVSGHGVGAALYMATAKGAIQSEGRRIVSPRELLARTNEVLLNDFFGNDVFATAFFARFYPAGRRVDFANGGHNPPLYVSRRGEAMALPSGGPALGLVRGAAYREESIAFGPGDTLIVYTDGLVEARDAGRRFFGVDRLSDLARSTADATAAHVRDRIFEELDAFAAGGALHDDVTVVVVRGTAPAGGGVDA